MLQSSRKKILILVDWFVPGYKAGGPIQSCKNFVKAFKDEYDLYIITSDRDIGDTIPYKGIQLNHWIKYDTTVNIYYASNKKLNFSVMGKLISEVQPDYIHLNNMFSPNFTIIPLLLKLSKKIKGKIILSPRGMLQDGAMNFKTTKKKLFLTVFRFFKIPQKITFHATDDQEKKDIVKYFPEASHIFVAGNFSSAIDLEWAPVIKVPGELKLIFLSRISPKKNLLYVLKLLAENSFKATIILDIAGSIEDKVYWEECKDTIKRMPSNVHVTYLGSIRNDEIYETYSHYHVFILPTLGENFGHAIFEAFLAGKPVLISDKTPWKNLSYNKAGYEIPLSEPMKFKEVIQIFADLNQGGYNLWSRSAYSYAKQYQAASETKSKYKEIFK